MLYKADSGGTMQDYYSRLKNRLREVKEVSPAFLYEMIKLQMKASFP